MAALAKQSAQAPNPLIGGIVCDKAPPVPPAPTPWSKPVDVGTTGHRVAAAESLGGSANASRPSSNATSIERPPPAATGLCQTAALAHGRPSGCPSEGSITSSACPGTARRSAVIPCTSSLFSVETRPTPVGNTLITLSYPLDVDCQFVTPAPNSSDQECEPPSEHLCLICRVELHSILFATGEAWKWSTRSLAGVSSIPMGASATRVPPLPTKSSNTGSTELELTPTRPGSTMDLKPRETRPGPPHATKSASLTHCQGTPAAVSAVAAPSRALTCCHADCDHRSLHPDKVHEITGPPAYPALEFTASASHEWITATIGVSSASQSVHRSL